MVFSHLFQGTKYMTPLLHPACLPPPQPGHLRRPLLLTVLHESFYRRLLCKDGNSSRGIYSCIKINSYIKTLTEDSYGRTQLMIYLKHTSPLHVSCDMLHEKCYVLHVTCAMLCKNFIIYGERGDQELCSWLFGHPRRPILWVPSSLIWFPKPCYHGLRRDSLEGHVSWV